MTAQEINAIAVRVAAELLKTRLQPREVLNLEEAAAFVGKPSVEAFHEWRKRFQVPACGHGRYSLRSLRDGLEREAAQVVTKKRWSKERRAKAAISSV
jgi:hypothetical protein